MIGIGKKGPVGQRRPFFGKPHLVVQIHGNPALGVRPKVEYARIVPHSLRCPCPHKFSVLDFLYGCFFRIFLHVDSIPTFEHFCASTYASNFSKVDFLAFRSYIYRPIERACFSSSDYRSISLESIISNREIAQNA